MAINVPRLPMTAQEFERMPVMEGLRIELLEGNLDVAAAAQMSWHAAGIPEYWLVEQHPDDDYDAVINVYVLSPEGRYALDRTTTLSALLKEK